MQDRVSEEGMQRYQREVYQDPNPPRPPADIPYPQGIPLPAERPAEAPARGPALDLEAPPRPPADIPFAEGIPLPAARPAEAPGPTALGPSGVEKAQTFLNRPVESILRQHAPDKIGKAGLVLDLKQPLREALKGPFGGQICPRSSTESRSTRADAGRSRQSHGQPGRADRRLVPVGGPSAPRDDSWARKTYRRRGTGRVLNRRMLAAYMHRDESATDGGWGAFAKPGNVEDRRTEQLARADLSALKTRRLRLRASAGSSLQSVGCRARLGDLPMPTRAIAMEPPSTGGLPQPTRAADTGGEATTFNERFTGVEPAASFNERFTGGATAEPNVVVGAPESTDAPMYSAVMQVNSAPTVNHLPNQ